MLLSFFTSLMTVVLVLDCLFLLLLILIQLPKKEAGLGQAFGSGATDALFGAGSGTALTKMTKYASGIFFVLTFLLAIMNAQQSKARRGSGLGQAMEKAAKAAPAQPVTPAPQTAANVPVKPTMPPLKLTSGPVEVPTAPSTSASNTTLKVTLPTTTVPTVTAEAPTAPAVPAAGTNKPAPPQPK